ncbi:hypothetical protein AEAC466_18965 [Asticcacaulis sp. AC466]|uniref:ankyrin repeat domain-containing protein n=1 Tax=Asticcacaulis sp. AC466 TaxID=1282362 RepID=UPI0003C3F79A|nr:ankyrin repeat domain-containing protein [Asticcacaulis sp. AC466]ESQ82000.1 hypothetical protein AEAC466_18965 [Asticcacaulis sp. AC466]
MENKLYRFLVTAALGLATPGAAMAAMPPDCTPTDIATAFRPASASFRNARSPDDIDRAFSELEPSSEFPALEGIITDPEIYYRFDTTTQFGFRAQLIVGVNGRVRCFALAPTYGQTTQPELTAQRRTWANEISRWRFRPLVIDGKPTEAIADLDVREYELPQREIPMPDGDVHQVTIIQDMPYFGYRIEVHGDGRAIYSDTSPYYFLGPQAYTVDPKSVARLLHEAQAADFWSLRDVYPPHAENKGRYISRIEITLGGKTKSLTEYDQKTGTGLPPDGHFLAFGVRHVIDMGSWWVPTLATIDQLKQNGFDFKTEAAGRFLLQIAENKYVKDEVVLAVLALGAPQDAFGISQEDGEPRTLLEAALSAGRIDIAAKLVADGALISDGKIDHAKVDRAFQAAVESGDLVALDLILPFQPDLTFADPNAGNIPVSVLFKLPTRYPDESAPIDVAQRLLDLGADINARDAAGQTLLHRQRDNEAMITFLLDHGADINALDKDGETPLVSVWDEDMTLLLLERGANPRLGNTPKTLHQFLSSGQWPRVATWLRAHGYADIVNPPKAS